MSEKLVIGIFLMLIGLGDLSAQVTQTVRGRVEDAITHTPLPGALVVLRQGEETFSSATGSDGRYQIEDVPVGRYSAEISFIGYKTSYLSPVFVNSGKEAIVNAELEESATMIDEVEVKAGDSRRVNNEMAVVSAKSFTVEETERYAGSRGDPARMVSNFAGVQGADDSRNDIVVRGNSPLGVLYRLENVDIPNPNHFAIAGSQGGPVSILNNKVLGNSDFFSGAFPAEYGNALAAIFDINLRNGNNRNYEFTGQFGFLGTELTAEGPLNKESGSSFLANYRYSSLQLFEFMGIPIGTSAIPQYQDMSFKLNFPTEKGSWSVFGIGGLSGIDIIISDQEDPSVELYGQSDRDQYFDTDMGVIGVNHVRSFGKNTFGRFTFSHSLEQQRADHRYVHRNLDENSPNYFQVDSVERILDYRFRVQKSSFNTYLVHKLDRRHSLKFGLYSDVFFLDFRDSLFNVFDASSDYYRQWQVRWNAQETEFMIRPFMSWKYKLDDEWELNTGLHGLYSSLGGNPWAVEPRVGLEWQFRRNQSFGFGSGLHSQLQPYYMYYYGRPRDGILQEPNRNMGLSRSWHNVLSYQVALPKNLGLKVETYYQYLYNIPVEAGSSSFSLSNIGSGFSRFFPDTALVNEGLGYNYGLEVTFQKATVGKYFFMLTASLFESKYMGSDGVWRDTDFNGNYAFNGILSREVRINDKSRVTAGLKATWVGGRRISPVDPVRSARVGEVVFVDELRNTEQLDDYFRFDLKFNYFYNAKKVTHEIGLDLVNVLNIKNILGFTYAPNPTDANAEPIVYNYQLGFLPIFYYRIDF